ncbi:MAG: hypothetical protein P8X91_02970 [Candidatus Bathyarchaeota archaeon]
MVVQEVFEILYSPVKAFRKVIEKPDFKGVILVLVLVISSMLIVQYIASSKLLLENRNPEDDNWTETLTNQHSWASNGLLTLDSTDYKLGNLDGNHSIVSSFSDETNIWCKLENISSINCSETGFKELFFFIKWTNDDESFPISGSIKLFSGTEESYFENNNFIDALGLSGNWKNITLNVGSNQGWSSNNSPNWEEITGLEFQLVWESSSNLSLKIDSLFFRNYISPFATGAFEGIILTIAFQVMLNFATNLILWAGLLLIIAKLFQEEVGPWNVFFIIIGYSFIVTVVYTLLSAIPLSTLPMIEVPIDQIALNAMLDVTWRPLIAYQLWLYIPIIGEVWLAALGAIVIRQIREINWSKAATIAAVAFAIRFILRLLFGF